MPKKKRLHLTDILQLNDITCTSKVLAQIDNCTTRAIERQTAPDDQNYIGLKKEQHGKYILGINLKTIYKNKTRKQQEAQSGFKDARERRENIEADLAALELAKQKKEIISVEDHLFIIDKIISAIQTKIPNWYKRAAPDVYKINSIKEIENKLEHHANRLLTDLSNIGNIARSLVEHTKPSNGKIPAVKTKRTNKIKRVGR